MSEKGQEVATATPRKSVLVAMAERFEMEPAAFESTVKKTVMPANVTNEQFAAFLLVAKEYNLNPITKEVYAFPAKGGGIQPIVSIDGWLNIINSHPQFDGMQFEDVMNGESLISVTCKIFRKDRKHPTEVTEYMKECKGTSEPWKRWPVRMLRHKATIQAARYAFGFSGIADPDEADRMETVGVLDTSEPEKPSLYSDADFDKNFPSWKQLIELGKKTPDDIINMVETKKPMTDEHKQAVMDIKAPVDAEEVE